MRKKLLRHMRKILTWLKSTKYSACSLQQTADYFNLSKPSISNMANPTAKQQLQDHHLDKIHYELFFEDIGDEEGMELYKAVFRKENDDDQTEEPVEEEGFTDGGEISPLKTAQPNHDMILAFVKMMKDEVKKYNGMYELSAFELATNRVGLGIDRHKRPSVWLKNHFARDFIKAVILIETGLTKSHHWGIFEEHVGAVMCNGTILIKYLTWVSPELDARLHEIIDGVVEKTIDLKAIAEGAAQAAIDKLMGTYDKLLEKKDEALEAEKERGDKLNELVKELGSEPNRKDLRYIPGMTNFSKMKKAIRALYPSVPDNLANYVCRVWRRLCWWYEVLYQMHDGQRRPGDQARIKQLDETYESSAPDGSAYYTTVPVQWTNENTGKGFVQRKRRQLFSINIMAGLLTQANWPLDGKSTGLFSPLQSGYWSGLGKGGLRRHWSPTAGWLGLDAEDLKLSDDTMRDVYMVSAAIIDQGTEATYKELNAKILELGGGVNGEVAGDVYMENPENRENREAANGS